MTNEFDKLDHKPVYAGLLAKAAKLLFLLGGRTRARTWDPLIKSQTSSSEIIGYFFKLNRNQEV